MAFIPIERTSCLDSAIIIDRLSGAMFTQENEAHQFVITCTQNNAQLTLTGTITAKVVLANGNTVELVGTIDGGKAVVSLTQPCYNTAGRIQISIFNTVGSTKLCIYAAIAYVQTAEHGDLIDGSQIIDSVEDLIADIQAAVATIPPDYSTLSNQVADLKSVLSQSEISDEIALVGGKKAYLPLVWEYGMINAQNQETFNDRQYYARSKGYYKPSENEVLHIREIDESITNVYLVYSSAGVLESRNVVDNADVVMDSTKLYRFVFTAASTVIINLDNVRQYTELYYDVLYNKIGIDNFEEEVEQVVEKLPNLEGSLVYVESPNLIDDSEILNGYTELNGKFHENDNYKCSGKIKVTPGNTYSLWHIANAAVTGISARFITAYSGDLAITESGATYANQYTVPSGIDYIVVSVSANAWNTLMLIEGTEYNYSPNGEKYYEPLYEIPYTKLPVSKPSFEKRLSSMSSGNVLRLNYFPINTKKNICYTFSGKISDAFSRFRIGQGVGMYKGRWLDIDAENIYVKKYESSETTVGTLAHGLTFSDFITLSMNIDDTGYGHCIIFTNGGAFTHDFNMGYEYNGDIMASPTMAMTDCVLRATSLDLNAKVWMFGDSYFGVFENRIIGQLCSMGYFKNIYINALPGRNSPDSLLDLKKALQYGRPQYIVWCLGMNDNEANYSATLTELKDICAKYQIELILYKIPTVAVRKDINNAINAIVENSGLRFVDAFSAVGTNLNGVWYDGYLSTDGVHPNPIGAKAIASQIIIDFPEISVAGWNYGTVTGIPRQ